MSVDTLLMSVSLSDRAAAPPDLQSPLPAAQLGVADATTYAWGGVVAQGVAMVIGIAATRPRLAGLFAHCGGRLRRIALARAEPVGGMHGWRSAMPVTQWAVEKP